MILDDLMPRYDVVERHRTTVRAAPAVVYAALRDANLGAGPVTRTLLTLRALPALCIAIVRSPRAAMTEWRQRRPERTVRLADFERAGFSVVAERPPAELVLGLVGRFWTPGGGLCSGVSAETFRAPPPSGHALAGWNFSIQARPGGETELRTETRVLCAPDAVFRFRLYWLLVRPGSGLIRRSMLHAIRRQAEHSSPLAQ